MSQAGWICTDFSVGRSPSEVYAALAEQLAAKVTIVFGPGVYRELLSELHSAEAVQRWALELVVRLDRPVLVNVPDKDGSSNTLAIAPPGWSSERLAGYVAGRYAELEDEFGYVDRVQGIA